MEASITSPGSRQGGRRGGVSKNRNAPRASLACLKCRERKIKCDVQSLEGRGRCTPCRTACTECVVRHDDDRKWRASKNYIVTLEERIKSLEGTIKANLPSIDSTSWKEQGTEQESGTPRPNNQQIQVSQTDSNFGSPATDHHWSQSSYQDIRSVTAATTAVLGSSDGSDQSLPLMTRDSTIQTYQSPTAYSNVDLPPVSQISSHYATTPRPLVPWTSVQQIAVANQTQQSECFEGRTPSQRLEDGQAIRSYPSPLSTSTEPVNRLRDNSPSYEEDREVKQKVRLRCFGPTCPLHVLLRPNPPDPMSMSGDLDSCLPSLDSEQFQKELLNIFWDFQPLAITVVHRETFMEHFLHGTAGEYYSDFLLNCILACAVRLSTRITIRSLSTLYIKRAKAELVNAMEQATIATLQGFTLLSDFEMSSGRDQAGWLYAGIACRLLFDLGLHQDCSDLVRTGHLSETEAAIRRQVFFSCLVNERLWCIYLGRPTLIKLSDFSTQRPKITDSSFELQTQAAWVDLSLMSSEISDTFNCPSLVDEQTIRKLSEVDARLHSWYDSLPLTLKSSDSFESDLHPHVIALHMQFFGIQVLVHRTYIMTRRKFSPAAFSEEEICRIRGQSFQHWRKTYRDSAVKIAQLLNIFKQKVGLERVPTVMLDNMYIATIALIAYVSKSDKTGAEFEEDIQWMTTLLDALEALQVHYPVAIRMRLTLSDVLQRGWLANSANSPLRHKLMTQDFNTEADSASSIQRIKHSYNRNKPPIFDTADLWIIPENYGDIGYPQYFDGTGHQAYEGMDLDPGAMIDTTTYAVNGMDLLDM